MTRINIKVFETFFIMMIICMSSIVFATDDDFSSIDFYDYSQYVGQDVSVLNVDTSNWNFVDMPFNSLWDGTFHDYPGAISVKLGWDNETIIEFSFEPDTSFNEAELNEIMEEAELLFGKMEGDRKYDFRGKTDCDLIVMSDCMRLCMNSDDLLKYMLSRTESNTSKSQNINVVSEPTLGESNALRRAEDYLNLLPMSYKGLIDQLKFDGYTQSEATYAADNCGADWKKMAAEKAQDYLDLMPMSKSQLQSQLEFDGFTSGEASYGVTAVGY